MAKFTQLFKEIQDNSITPIKTTFCGDLESLETTAKDNLVNAINELKNSSGGASSGGGDYLPKASQLLEWNNNNLTTSIYNSAGSILRSDFGIGYKNGIIGFFGRFVIKIETRTSNNPGLKIELPSEWQIEGYLNCSRGNAFKVASQNEESQIMGIRPYYLVVDVVTHSILIRMTESFTNVSNGSIYEIDIPLTYIKL